MRGKALAWALSQAWAILPEALELGLQIAARENESIEAVEARLGRPLENTHEVTYRDTPQGRAAVIPIRGPIFRYADSFGLISGGTSVQTLATDLRAALDDDSVASVVLYIDSPGGEANGVAEFAGMVRAAQKPTVAYVGGRGASAAYWIASAADRVVASPSAMVGSIGVVMAAQSEPDKPGRYTFTSSAAPLKRADPGTDKGRAAIQGLIDDLHGVFEGDVANYRGVSRETVRGDFGRGGVLIAEKARQAGMIDAVGSFEGVIADLGAGRLPGRTNRGKQGGGAMASDRTLKEKILSVLLGGEGQATDDTPPLTNDDKGVIRVVAGRFAPEDHAAVTGLSSAEREELVRLRASEQQAAAERERQALTGLETEALGFADGLIARHAILPAERASVAQQYAAIAIADRGLKATVAKVANGDGPDLIAVQAVQAGEKAALLDSFRASFAGRTPHLHTQDVLRGTTTPLAPAKPADEREKAFDAAGDQYLASIGLKQ